MKYMHLFMHEVYDQDNAGKYPLIITWSGTCMEFPDCSPEYCLAVSCKSELYRDHYQVSEALFESILLAFTLFPDVDDQLQRLEYAKALLNK